MPEICRFLGISIAMYFNDHNPPHYHVKYNEFRAILEIGTSRVSVSGQEGMMVYVLSAEYVEEYKIDIVFNDGTRSRIDLEPTLANDTRSIVRALLDVSLFAQVSVAMDTLVWPNGFDLAPEFLYDLARVRRTA